MSRERHKRQPPRSWIRKVTLWQCNGPFTHDLPHPSPESPLERRDVYGRTILSLSMWSNYWSMGPWVPSQKYTQILPIGFESSQGLVRHGVRSWSRKGRGIAGMAWSTRMTKATKHIVTSPQYSHALQFTYPNFNHLEINTQAVVS